MRAGGSRVQAIRGPQGRFKRGGIKQHYFSTRQTWPMPIGDAPQPQDHRRRAAGGEHGVPRRLPGAPRRCGLRLAVRLGGQPRDGRPDGRLLRLRVAGRSAPGPGDLARARDAHADGRQRGRLGLAAVPDRPARPLALGLRVLRLLRVRHRRDRLPGAARPRVLPASAVARRGARRRRRRDRLGRGPEPGALRHPGRLRHGAGRLDLHGRGPARGRADRRAARRARPARRIDVAVDRRRTRPLLCG